VNVFYLVQIGLAGQKMGALYSIQKGKLANFLLLMIDRGIGAFISKDTSLLGVYIGALLFVCVSEFGAVRWAFLCSYSCMIHARA